MADDNLSRIDELTGSLLKDLRLYREALEQDQRFEIVKSIKERIRKMEAELDQLLQQQTQTN